MINYDTHSYSLFQTKWWLDAVAPSLWDEVVIEKGGQIIGRFPYLLKQKYGFRALTQPPLTKIAGPWIREFKGKSVNKVAYQKKVLTQLIGLLPEYDYFHQFFDYSIDNWQPFYWKGFYQTTYYSFIIHDIFDPEFVFASFRSEKRNDIRRSQRIVEVKEDLPVHDLFNHHKNNLAKKGAQISYDFELLSRIYKVCYERSSGKVFYAVDEDQRIHSAIFVIWDSRSAYYLINSIDPELKHSAATSLLTWSAIKYLSDKTKKFDFEGSMIEGVAGSYRAFGAQPTPYSAITQIKSPIIQLGFSAKALWQVIKPKN